MAPPKKDIAAKPEAKSPQKPAGKVELGASTSVNRPTGQPSPAERERGARNEPGEGGRSRGNAGSSPTPLTPSPSPAKGRGELEKKKVPSQSVAAGNDKKKAPSQQVAEQDKKKATGQQVVAGKEKKKGKKPRQVKWDDNQQKGPQNELVVSVWNPCDTASIACGTQSFHPDGALRHTATSGIWQTVWLETVPAASIERLEMTADVERVRAGVGRPGPR